MTNPKNKPAFVRWTDPGGTLTPELITAWYNSSSRITDINRRPERFTKETWTRLSDLFCASILDQVLSLKDLDIAEFLEQHQAFIGSSPSVRQAISFLLDALHQPFIAYTAKSSQARPWRALSLLATAQDLPKPLVHRLTEALFDPVLQARCPDSTKYDLAISLLPYPSTPKTVYELLVDHLSVKPHSNELRLGQERFRWAFVTRLAQSPRFSQDPAARQFIYPVTLTSHPDFALGLKFSYWADLDYPNLRILTQLLKKLGPSFGATVINEITNHPVKPSLIAPPDVVIDQAIGHLLSELPPIYFAECPKPFWAKLLQSSNKEVRILAAKTLGQLGSAPPSL